MEGILDALKKARLEKNLSQSELAAKLNIPQSHLSKIESGKVNPTLGIVIEIARTLDMEPILVPVKYLIPIESLLRPGKKQTPMYTIPNEDEDE